MDFARILKFNQNHDEKNGRFISGEGAGEAGEEILGSPNNDENQSLNTALAQMKSTQLNAYADDSEAIDKQYGFSGEKERSLGLYEGAFEGAVIDHIKGNVPEPTLEVAAATLGKKHKQKSMAVWTDSQSGPHELYTFQIPDNIVSTGNALKREGVIGANLVPKNGGTSVSVIGLEPDQDAALNLGIKLGATDVTYKKGTANFVGEADYDRIIANYKPSKAVQPPEVKPSFGPQARLQSIKSDYDRRNRRGLVSHHAVEGLSPRQVLIQRSEVKRKFIQGLD